MGYTTLKVFGRNQIILLSSPVEGSFIFLFFGIPSVSGRRDEERAYKLKYGLHMLCALICDLLFHPLNFWASSALLTSGFRS